MRKFCGIHWLLRNCKSYNKLCPIFVKFGLENIKIRMFDRMHYKLKYMK